MYLSVPAKHYVVYCILFVSWTAVPMQVLTCILGKCVVTVVEFSALCCIQQGAGQKIYTCQLKIQQCCFVCLIKHCDILFCVNCVGRTHCPWLSRLECFICNQCIAYANVVDACYGVAYICILPRCVLQIRQCHPVH